MGNIVGYVVVYFLLVKFFKWRDRGERSALGLDKKRDFYG